MSPIVLLVAVRGPDAGVTAPLTGEPLVVGRSRECGMRVADRCLSRQHFRIHWDGTAARVECLQGVAPLWLRGDDVTEATLTLGDEFLVGDTAFALRAVRSAAELKPEEAPASSVAVRTLFHGAAQEARWLRAVHELVTASVAWSNHEQLEAGLASWAREELGAHRTEVYRDEDGVSTVPPRLGDLRARPDDVVVLAPVGNGEEGDWRIAVPCHGHELAWILWSVPAASDEPSESVQRLCAVAGRIIGAVRARLEVAREAELQQASFRHQAIGSATGFSGTSPAAAAVATLAQKLARSDASVVLLGETGTGKSFLARVLHEQGPRRIHPFRTVNCAAIPAELAESELFGHERGAFSGAVASRVGAFEAAGSGTLFLDEIAELSPAHQAKLLLALEEKAFRRVGGERLIPLRARLIAATHRDPEQWVREGRFRQDLLYRLGALRIVVPSLRDRVEDIPSLAERMLADLMPTAGRRVVGFTARALEALCRYPWPGNVRELRNVVEAAVVLGDSARIDLTDLPHHVQVAATPAARASAASPAGAPTGGAEAGDGGPGLDPFHVTLPMALEELTDRAVWAALEATGHNRTRAAALLGVNRSTIQKRLREMAGRGFAVGDLIDADS